MASTTELITAALAPGIALSTIMLYVSGLQARFSYVATRTRELNKEARELLLLAGPPSPRLLSIKRQVDVLMRRIGLVRRTILICYGALFCFILSILLRLAEGLMPTLWPVDGMPLLAFGLGFLALGAATLHSSAEMLLSVRTLHEDVDTSFPAGLHPARPIPDERVAEEETP